MKQHLTDLANRCYQNGHYTFSHFLSLSEIDEFFQIQKDLSFVDYTLFGGSADAERQMLRFGSEESFGYVEEFPICCIYCRPMTPKFAEPISHRDVLGALMHLGIERDVIGDIWVRDKESYFFCLENMEEFICDNLSKIRHTNVVCSKIDGLPQTFTPEKKREEHIIVSERCDALISKVYKISRRKCIPLFQNK